MELSLGQVLMHEIVNNIGKSCPWIIIKLPKNYDMVAFKRGLKRGQILLDEDLSDHAGRVKMKLVVVFCQIQSAAAPQGVNEALARQQQHQHHMMMMQRKEQQSLNLTHPDSKINGWKEAIENISFDLVI